MSADALSQPSYFKIVIEQCLREGFAPRGAATVGTRGSAVREAAKRIGMKPSTLNSWVDRNHVDWGLFNIVDPAPTPAAPPPADPIELRRRDDAISSHRATIKDLESRLIEALDIRQGILGLTSEPLKPTMTVTKPHPHVEHGRQAVILHLSDLHAGEVISAPEILGSNRYDLSVFRARIGRLFQACADLCTKHWPSGDRPLDEIIVCLGGDLVSGSIHPELAETNDGTDYQIFKEVAQHIAGGLKHLREVTGLPIRVYSVPGNHGRQTFGKPHAKRQGLQSWDILVSDFAEAALASDKGVTWFRSEGTDCYFDVFGWPILLTHGHAMGSGGGQGFIGPMAPIARGHQKVSHSEYRQRRPIYLILSAHYHTTVKTPWGWGNGSLVGYNEYVRNTRGEPEAAQQNMLVLHEHRGLIRWHPLYVGDPSEGTLYQGAAGWRSPMHRMDDVDGVTPQEPSRESAADTTNVVQFPADKTLRRGRPSGIGRSRGTRSDRARKRAA